MPSRIPISLYVHWPYCSFLCKFCGFSKARVPKQGIDHGRIASALLKELRTSLTPHMDKTITSIYFGGGTPSLARPRHIGQIIEEASRIAHLDPGAEITIESNPTSAEVAKMRDFKMAGVNRYSIGVQTLSDKSLARMGRLHTGAEGLAAVDRAKSLFPGHVSFDMIFGFEGQTVEQWQRELEVALAHADKHISIYELTVEAGTPLYRDTKARRTKLPYAATTESMYEVALELCRAKGFRHYEVSNYAASPNAESKHNKAYWQGQQWIGIGPSACSRYIDPANGKRTSSVRAPSTNMWMQMCEDMGHGTAKSEVIGTSAAKAEFVVCGLRMLDGISNARFREVSDGQSLSQFLRMEQVEHCVSEGCLAWDGSNGSLRPTEKGLAVIDSILLNILPSSD
ncbi:radical S-adenosyl methionine domain-containing protein 1 [Dipsacomyces acuminosporus]|nr:radical S-adenosyl methionine domain-containing protein 1 [Dipsacomyces acuminosporus]